MTNPYGVRPPTRLDSSAFADWNAANQAARRAYNIDATRLCVTCEDRKRDGRHLRCWTCRREGVVAA